MAIIFKEYHFLKKPLFSLTTKEEDVEGLMGVQDDQLRPKDDPGSLVLVVVHLDCCVARTPVGHHPGLITVLWHQQTYLS